MRLVEPLEVRNRPIVGLLQRRRSGLEVRVLVEQFGVRAADIRLVEHAHREREEFDEFRVVRRRVEAIEAIEEAESVPGPGEDVLPPVVHLHGGIRKRRLDDDDPRSPHGEGDATQHFELEPFHVDLEEVDLAPFEAVLGEQMVESGRGNLDVHHLVPIHVDTSDVLGDGGQPGAEHLVKRDRAGRIPGAGLEHDVPRSVRTEFPRIGLGGLDVDARPAPLVERLGDAVDQRMRSADIDIASVDDVLQCPPEDDVLGVLCVRAEHGFDVNGLSGSTSPSTAHPFPHRLRRRSSRVEGEVHRRRPGSGQEPEDHVHPQCHQHPADDGEEAVA